MLAADRAVGNTMEWALVFLPLLWSTFFVLSAQHLSTAGLSSAAWLYVVCSSQTIFSCGYFLIFFLALTAFSFLQAARALYLPTYFLSKSGRKGVRPLIFLATTPGYISLVYLSYRLVSACL